MDEPRKRTSAEEIARLRQAVMAREQGAYAPAGGRITTGFDALDEALCGGFHAGALNELFTAASGSGAFEALLPAIGRAGGGRRLLAWIHPTYTPYPPALAQAGCDLDRWLIVRPLTDADHLWSVEQALRSRACAVVIACFGDLSDRVLRRLQVAAREGGGVAILSRPAALMSRASPAAVRLFAEPERAADPRRRRVRMTVLRCRGAVPSDSSVVLEWSRDSLDERPSSSFADRTRGSDVAGRGQEPARARIA